MPLDESKSPYGVVVLCVYSLVLLRALLILFYAFVGLSVRVSG